MTLVTIVAYTISYNILCLPLYIDASYSWSSYLGNVIVYIIIVLISLYTTLAYTSDKTDLAIKYYSNSLG